jgi:hypothetical protein
MIDFETTSLENLMPLIKAKADEIERIIVLKFKELKKDNPSMDAGWGRVHAEQSITLHLLSMILVKLDLL